MCLPGDYGASSTTRFSSLCTLLKDRLLSVFGFTNRNYKLPYPRHLETHLMFCLLLMSGIIAFWKCPVLRFLEGQESSQQVQSYLVSRKWVFGVLGI